MKQKISRARSMRHIPTDAENKLWRILRSRQLAGYKFRRQHPIKNFIADFACPKHRLIIEADGSQHNESIYDVERTRQLNEQGWKF